MDERKFINEILSWPESDEPRLIYADWLEERDDPRGEFIRVQCALSQDRLDSTERQRLKRRERELLRAHNKTWLSERPSNTRDPKFVRGFIGHIAMNVKTFISQGFQICAQVPLESIELTGGGDQMKDLIKCKWLRQIKAINFKRNRFPAHSIASFAACVYLENLQSLEISATRCDLNDLRALCNPFSMRELRCLSLDYTNINDRGMCMVADAECFRNLESLRLEKSDVSGDFIQGALFNESLRKLEISDARYNPRGNAIIHNLIRADSPVFPNLEALILNGMFVSNHSFVELVNSHRFPNLHTLGLNHCDIDDDGAFVLAGSQLLGQLTDLRMSYNNLDLDGIMALARSPQRRKGARFYLPQESLAKREVAAFRSEFGNFGELA